MRPPYQQRDLIKVKDCITLPENIDINHPFLILSPNDVNEREGHYVCVMMSGSTHRNRFSFLLNDDMFESPLKKANCQFRLHLIVSVRASDIRSFENVMKPQHFKHVMNQVKELVFRYP